MAKMSTYATVLALIALALPNWPVPYEAAPGASTQRSSRYEVDWERVTQFSMTTFIDDDHPAYAMTDLANTSADVVTWDGPYFTLDPASRNAVDIWPQWLNSSLSLALSKVPAGPTRSSYVSILDGPGTDPRQIDEIAFSIAHMPTEDLTDTSVDPELFRENVRAMYAIDLELEYARIIDIATADGQRSTVEYSMPGGNRSLPPEIYYRYLASPRNTMEVPAYIDISTLSASNSTHGEFWRGFLYNMTSDPSYPVLSEYLKGESYLWKGKKNEVYDNGAMGAVCRWQRECMPQFGVPPDGVRTKQPIIDYFHHWGMCGENSDLLTAASKIALIPCVQVVNFGSWHAWNHFYDDGWHAVRAYDMMIDDPFAEGAPGNTPALAALDPDGSQFGATPLYTPTSNLTVTVTDAQGNPVDGALVNLASTPQYNNPYGIGLIANVTDASGRTRFEVGVGFDYFVHVYSGCGQNPSSPTDLTLAIPQAPAGKDLTFNISVPGRIFDQMGRPILDEDRDNGLRFTLKASSIDQTVSYHRDPLGYGHTVRNLGDLAANLRIAFLDDVNLDRYLAGGPFTPARVENLTRGRVLTVILPQDRAYHPVLIGRLQPYTVSSLELEITVDISSVSPDVEVLQPVSGTYRSSQEIAFKASVVPDPPDLFLTYLWTTNRSAEPLSDQLEFSMRLGIGRHRITFSVLQGGSPLSSDHVDIEVRPPNLPPVALISSPSEGEVIEHGTAVRFGSNGSHDPEGGQLLYRWTDLDRRAVVSLSGSFSMKFEPGRHSIILNVTDPEGSGDEDRIAFEVVPRNNAPTAWISEPIDGAVIYDDEELSLSAQGSTDLDDDILTVAWRSSIDGLLSDRMFDSVRLSPGEHHITLNVSDGRASSEKGVRVSVLVRPPDIDLPPIPRIASPADGSHYNLSDTIVFDSKGSLDPEGGSLTFRWDIDGELVSERPRFTSRVDPGIHTLLLSVSDGNASVDISATFLVIDRSPFLVLTVNGTEWESNEARVFSSETVVLDLSGSFDPDMTSLMYHWSIDGANVSDQPRLEKAFPPGTYLVFMSVRDSTGRSAVRELAIIAKERPGQSQADDGGSGGGWLTPMTIVPIVLMALSLVLLLLIGILRYRTRGPGAEE